MPKKFDTTVLTKLDYTKNLSLNTIKPLIIIDAGHGGLDLSGQYVTHPDKRFEHMGTQVNEGVLNRAIAHLLSFRLDLFNTPNCIVSSSEAGTELSLKYRCEVANYAAKKHHEKTGGKAILISIHHNYFKNTKVRGFEVFSYYGKKESSAEISKAADYIAHYCGLKYANTFAKSIVRRNTGSKDLFFKKENFKILRETSMPALLFEFGFMSNAGDYYFMSSYDGIVAHANYLENVINNVITYNYLDFNPPMLES